VKFRKAISLVLALVIVFSVEVCSLGSVFATSQTNQYQKYIYKRGQDLKNTYAKLSAGDELNIVYFGGSVTNGTGATNAQTDSWRGLVGQWFVDNFNNVTINNINSAIGATGSKFGAYRLNHDVIAHKPDLVFVEFAINDYYDNQGEDIPLAEYGMRFETIVRNIRKELPLCDIVTVYTTEISHVNTNQAGELHDEAKEHEKICVAYNIPSIHIGRALADKITVGKAQQEWPEYFYDDGTNVHPNNKGYKIYFDAIKEYLENCLINSSYDGSAKNHTLPKMVNEYLLDGNIEVIDVDEALVTKSQELGGKNLKLKHYSEMNIGNPFRTFGDDGAASIEKNESVSFALEFTGTEIAILETCENDNKVEYYSIKVDNQEEKSVARQMTPTVLATGLEYGKHTVIIRPYFANSAKDNSKFLIKAFFVRDDRAVTAKYDHEHVYGNYISDKNASCVKNGTKTAKCCIKNCDKFKTVVDLGSKLTHKFVVVPTKKATLYKNGKGEKICSLCGRFDDVVTIKKIKSVKANDCHYNGKVQTPKVTVKDSAGKTVSSKYYTLKCYGKRKNLGSYKVKVTFKGNYSGSKTVKFKINPPKSSIKKLTAAKKSLKVKITKKTKQVKGYEIQYSTSKKFSKSTTKILTVSSNKKTTATLKGLKSKKKYYVRVRTYKTSSGKKYYSAWSGYKSKKTK